jgi:hypothetical protein
VADRSGRARGRPAADGLGGISSEVVSAAATAYTAAIQWTRAGRDQWICRLPPDARYTLKVFVKGDGRWSWEVFAGAALSPMATGIAGNVGAAKKTAEPRDREDKPWPRR